MKVMYQIEKWIQDISVVTILVCNYFFNNFYVQM